jgi:RND superfamily putative drug exporter
MLTKLATRIHGRARLVLVAVLVAAVAAGVLGAGVAGRLSPYGAEDPSTQSVKAKSLFEGTTGRQIDPGIVALVTPQSGRGVRSRAGRAAVHSVAAELARGPDVASVLTASRAHDPAMISRNGRSTFVLAFFKPHSDKRLSDDAKAIQRQFADQPQVKLGGLSIAQAQVNSQVGSDLSHAELLAFPFIFVLSLLFFRSIVAAALPPLLGGLAIVFTFLAMRALSGVVDMSVFALNLVTGMGLGLAIDYSLFIVSRYREEASRGGTFDVSALARTMSTAGRTVLFSSLTVAAALAALAVFPQRFLYSMAIGGVLVALIAMALALVALPAVLAVLGPRVNALAPARLQRAAARDARPDQSGVWYRLSQFVARRPGRIAFASGAVLIALGIPFTGIRFTTVDASVLPQSASARQVDEILAAQFPPHRTDALEVVIGARARSRQVAALAQRIRTLPGVSAVARPQPAGPRLSLLEVAPSNAIYSDQTLRLVSDVRGLRSPVYHGVTGVSAQYVDLRHSLSAHLPAVLAIVILATLVVLFLFTGSLVLPLKAILMNALTLSATFGALVLVFQHGRLEGLLGYRGQGAIDTTQPILLFAVAFGLATDYGVFLLSRIKEARDGGLSNGEAVAVGLERTGRIVTAAALLFGVAVGAFATSNIIFIKEFGLGTALAVLLDASVIRALLVPSLMELLGSLNWWAPRPLRALHRRIGLSETGTGATLEQAARGVPPVRSAA